MAYIHPHTLIEFAAKEMDASVAEVMGDSRMARIFDARRIGYWLVSRICGYGPCRVAQVFKRTHMTVLHSLRNVEKRRSSEEGYRLWLDDLERRALDFVRQKQRLGDGENV